MSHLVPFPGDLLVSWFFPYNSGGWAGFSPWTTHKEFILADVVRMMYPWRLLAMEYIKQGIIPLWNIYSFAGNPLIANLQSAVFYPLNILFLFLKPQAAWIIYIMIQPILATSFMYMFIRSIGLSRLAGIFAGIGFAFLGFLDVWFEMGIIGHAALWFPFILWGITKFINTKKGYFLVLAATGITCSLLSGYPQATAYALLFSLSYLIYIGWNKLTKAQLIVSLFILSLGFSLAAIQVIPTYELLSHSVQDKITATRVFHKYISPPSHIAMLFAPDFFGNPATNNFWGKDYGEFMSYSGIVVLLVAFIGFYTQFKHKLVRLSAVLAVIAYLVAFVPPVAELLFRSPIPLLNTELPSRTTFLAALGFVITSAYGVEAIQSMKLRKIMPPVLFFLAIYLVMWILVLTLRIDPVHLTVTKHNIILPTAIAFLAGLTILLKKYTKHFFVVWIILFVCMGFEYSYFLNKYLPLAPAQYMFPPHPLMTKLQEIAGSDRVYGYDTADVETNLMVQFRLQTPEGYDPLYIKNYSELVYAGKTGKLETDLPRSDALLPLSLPVADTYRKQVLLNLLGVKYLMDKDDSAPRNWDPRPSKFPPSRFHLVYQSYKWKIFENTKALPRAFVSYDYTVISQKDKEIQTLFDPAFPYRQKLIVGTAPTFSPHPSAITPVTISKYAANDIEIKTTTKRAGLLFLSDNFYPGWQATIDGKSTPIMLADYSFRAVQVPEGKHIVHFSYRPTSFYLGALISFVSLLLLGFVAKKYKA
ncbi:MAG TPA: YfhO family protein [Candidatus Saccharimonadales bacterium]|nr:YfhO family protein [Candidatus Saccharimonadales bacterium]